MQSGYYYMFTDSRNAMEMLNGDMLMELELRSYLIFVTALNWVYICVCTLTHIIKWASVQLHSAVTSYDVISYFFLFFTQGFDILYISNLFGHCVNWTSVDRSKNVTRTKKTTTAYWKIEETQNKVNNISCKVAKL